MLVGHLPSALRALMAYCIGRCFIGVDDLRFFQNFQPIEGLGQKPLGRFRFARGGWIKVESVTSLVNGAIEIDPTAFDF